MDERGWQGIAWAVAAVAAVLLAVRLLGGSEPAPPPVRVGDGAAVGAVGVGGQDGDGARATGLVVHVAGAVRRPGVYRFARDARVAAAVRRAGGAAPDADPNGINLAARLRDGQQVVVPTRASAAGAAAGETGDMPISLGSATVEQLDRLDGIGPTLARRIVEHRQAKGGFASLDQLAEVDGIGPERLAALEAALTP